MYFICRYVLINYYLKMKAPNKNICRQKLAIQKSLDKHIELYVDVIFLLK